MQLVLALLIVMSTLSFAHAAKPVADALRFDPRQMRSDLIKFNVAYARSEGDGTPRRERNLARLSAKWVPVLQRAETEGDAIATVLLRYCDSAPELLRTDIDSTCSQDVSAVARAYERLRAVGLGSLPDQSARFEVIGDTLRDNVRRKCTDARREACTVELAIELIDARIRAIETDAVLPPIPGLQRFVCNDARKDAALQGRCITRFHHLVAVQTLARRYFELSLVPRIDEFDRTREEPYADVGELDNAPREKKVKEHFHNEFYSAVYRSLLAVEASVATRITKDPRWSIFLRQTPAGLDRRPAPSQRSAQRTAPRKKMLWERQHDAMQRYIGTYEGAMIADGTTTVITKLFNRGSSSLEGRYMMIYGHDPHPRVELGLLGPCLLPSPRELFCVWLDRGGIGFVSMLFNARADEFKGMYTLYGRTGLLQRMEPAFWNQMTDWNGKLR